MESSPNGPRLSTSLCSYPSSHFHPSPKPNFPLTLLPIYTQATGYVGSCASSASSSYITSYGCNSFSNPGPCLCTNELSSSKIASAISSCGWYIDLALSDINSATSLWRDYCRTNGGVSVIHEESRLQEIPLFTQVTGYMSGCFTDQTASLRATFGCSDSLSRRVCARVVSWFGSRSVSVRVVSCLERNLRRNRARDRCCGQATVR